MMLLTLFKLTGGQIRLFVMIIYVVFGSKYGTQVAEAIFLHPTFFLCLSLSRERGERDDTPNYFVKEHVDVIGSIQATTILYVKIKLSLRPFDLISSCPDQTYLCRNTYNP